jgi:hypothetical protein
MAGLISMGILSGKLTEMIKPTYILPVKECGNESSS